MLPRKIAFIDTETTGARAGFDRIIEVGILRVEDNQIVKSFHTLLNPEAYLPPEIERLTGITYGDLENAPLFRQVKDEIAELLSDCVFAAHNVRFDYGFMKGEFKRENMDFSAKQLCTVKLSRYLYPQFPRHNLDAIIERFGISCASRHRAFEDAGVLFEFYKKILTAFPEDILQKAFDTVQRKPALPPKLTQDVLDNLPEQPGVYIFYGADSSLSEQSELQSIESQKPSTSPGKNEQVPLYIGKSKNIRDRVLSHFAADLYSSTEMKISQQIESIETIVTAGELGALFTESQLVKQMLPLYNRKLRLKKELVALKHHSNDDGYETGFLETITTINPDELSSFLGFFRSRKQAKEYLSKVAKEHQLCEKLLGLEKTSTSCFSYRLDVCKGACIKEELPIKYNLRFLEAFGKKKIKPWPFSGPIMIEEKNPLSGLSECFLVDKWCLIGRAKSDGDAENFVPSEVHFDLDIYQILLQYLRQEANIRKVRQVGKEQLSLFSASALPSFPV